MRTNGKTIVSRLMAEVINYGGIAGTRAQVYEHALSVCMSQLEGEPNQARRARLGADQFAFGTRARAMKPNEAACLIQWGDAVAAGIV